MKITQRVLGILSNSKLGRIRYQFAIGERAIIIDRHCFATVARAIRAKTVNVWQPYGLPTDAGAVYYGNFNEIQIMKITDRFDESALVHEAVHAYFDLARIIMDTHAEETAAYIASTLYLVMHGIRGKKLGTGAAPAAEPIADMLLEAYRRKPRTPPLVPDEAWQALKTVVAADPLYEGKKYTRDG